MGLQTPISKVIPTVTHPFLAISSGAYHVPPLRTIGGSTQTDHLPSQLLPGMEQIILHEMRLGGLNRHYVYIYIRNINRFKSPLWESTRISYGVLMDGIGI